MVFIKTRILPPIRADTTDEGGESLLHKKWLKMENLDSRKKQVKIYSGGY